MTQHTIMKTDMGKSLIWRADIMTIRPNKLWNLGNQFDFWLTLIETGPETEKNEISLEN